MQSNGRRFYFGHIEVMNNCQCKVRRITGATTAGWKCPVTLEQIGGEVTYLGSYAYSQFPRSYGCLTFDVSHVFDHIRFDSKTIFREQSAEFVLLNQVLKTFDCRLAYSSMQDFDITMKSHRAMTSMCNDVIRHQKQHLETWISDNAGRFIQSQSISKPGRKPVKEPKQHIQIDNEAVRSNDEIFVSIMAPILSKSEEDAFTLNEIELRNSGDKVSICFNCTLPILKPSSIRENHS